MNLSQRLIEFQKKCPPIELDGKVSYKSTKFKYATLGNIIDKVKPVLTAEGIIFSQVMEEGNLKTIITDGESELSSSHPLPQANNPQDLGKWITYLKRYQLCSILGIVGEEDVDGELNAEKPKEDEVRKRIVTAIEQADTHDKLNRIEERMEKIKYDADAEIQSLIMAKRDEI